MNQSAARPGKSWPRISGWILLALGVLLLAVLIWMPPTGRPYLFHGGVAYLILLGLSLLIRGPRKREAALATLLALTTVGTFGLMTARLTQNTGEAALSIVPSKDGCALRISGNLGEDFYPQLRQALDQNPQVRAVILNSGGGNALSITAAARLLNQRGVQTAVIDRWCASACAFLWVSAPRRIIAGRQATLAPAFHAPHVVVPWHGLMRANFQGWQQQRYLRREARLPEDFIVRAYAPLDGLWQPDAAQLNALGVPTEFIRTRHPEKLRLCEPPKRQMKTAAGKPAAV